MYLLPILTTYIKRQPQELKQVLKLIQDMQKQEEELNLTKKIIPPHLNPDTMKKDVDPKAIKLGSKDALEYVSWLVNPNKLYDVALTTYDFDLVTLVATQTQKDPKEYVPYLQELKSLDPIYMKFKIHLDLKQFDKAVKKLAKGGAQYFDEAMVVVRKQRLFKQALEYFKDDPKLLNKVKVVFGEYLEQRNYAEEAGFLYNAAGDIEKGLGAFKKSLNVDMSFSLAY